MKDETKVDSDCNVGLNQSYLLSDGAMSTTWRRSVLGSMVAEIFCDTSNENQKPAAAIRSGLLIVSKKDFV
jgi:hypothetical protein